MNAKDTTYNGWKNYETWNVALWLDNDRGTYEETREQMREIWDGLFPRPKIFNTDVNAAARIQFSDWLKSYVEEMQPNLGATLWADLLNAALSEVDWYEIADNWLSEIDAYEPRKVDK